MEYYSEQELLYMIRQQEPLSYEQLYNKYERLIWKIIHNHHLDTSDNWEEALALSRLAFQMAVDCYRENKGSKFSTFLHNIISLQLVNYQRDLYRKNRQCCNYEGLNKRDLDRISENMYKNSYTMNKVQDCQRMIHMVYEHLGDEEKTVLNLYLRGYKLKEIVEITHYRKCRIKYILSKFREKCREIDENKAFD